MYYIKSENHFDAAHFLKGYEGKCHNLHGHRWRVVVEVAGQELSTDKQTRDMLFDFGDLKSALKKMCDNLDHSLIYEEGSLKDATIAALSDEDFRMVAVPFRPTAERFSQYFFEGMKAKGFPVHRVDVYETPTNYASYGGVNPDI